MPFFSKNARRIYLSIICLAAIIWASYQIWLSTVHTVIPDQVYRSAQLSPQLFQYYIKTKNIKSIINLRGAQPYTKWYQQEIQIANQMNVIHYDINLSSHQIPSKERMRLLVYTLMHAPKPMLVHCLGGADRSGLASAIALILKGSTSLQKSYLQISPLHLVLSPTSIGKLVFPHYRAWLTKNHLLHSRENFLKWVCSEYPFNHHQVPSAKPGEIKDDNLCPAPPSDKMLYQRRFPPINVI